MTTITRPSVGPAASATGFLAGTLYDLSAVTTAAAAPSAAPATGA